MKWTAAATAATLTITFLVWPQPTTTPPPAVAAEPVRLSVAQRVQAATNADRSTRDPLPSPAPISTPTEPPPPPTPVAPTPPPSNSETSSVGTSGVTATGLPEPWRTLAQCESGLNPAAVNPSGPYYGLFQFLHSTWVSVGGTGYPHQASVAEQLHRAQILQARSGWGQWPVCAAGFG